MIKKIDISELSEEEKIIMIEAYKHARSDEYDLLEGNRKKNFVKSVATIIVDDETNEIAGYEF